MIADDEDFRIAQPLYAIAGRSLRDVAARRWRLALYVWNGDELELLDVEII